MIKQFEDLSESEQKKVRDVTVMVHDLLEEFEKLTGAEQLGDQVIDFIWDTVDFQALELA